MTGFPVDGEVLSEESRRRLRDLYPDVEIEIRVIIPADLAGEDVPQKIRLCNRVPRIAIGPFYPDMIDQDLERCMRLLTMSLCFRA